MTVKVPALVEVEGQLNDRRKKLAAVFAEAGENIDMAKVKSFEGESPLAYVRALNEEMTALGAKRDELVELRSIATRAIFNEGEEGPTIVESGADQSTEHKGASSFADAFFKAGGGDALKAGRAVELDDFDVKTTFSTSAGWAPFNPRNPRLVDYATRPIELLDFLPTAPMTAAAFTYMEETTFTNNAAETTEGSAKPEAALALTERTATARKVAVTLPVTDEQLEDVPEARAYLDQRLGFMVRQRLSGQVVAGDGSAPNIRGILNVSGIQTQAKGADPVPDAVYKAMTKIRVTGEAEPDAYVTHPNDWQDVRLLRTADGLYIWGNPSDAGPERIWGLPVIQVQAMTENTAVVGAWQMFSTLFIRRGLTVDAGYVNDDFSKNKQTLRAEMRAVPVFWRPAAFCTVTSV